MSRKHKQGGGQAALAPALPHRGTCPSLPPPCSPPRPQLTCKQLWVLQRELHRLPQRALALLQSAHLRKPWAAVLRRQHLQRAHDQGR